MGKTGSRERLVGRAAPYKKGPPKWRLRRSWWKPRGQRGRFLCCGSRRNRTVDAEKKAAWWRTWRQQDDMLLELRFSGFPVDSVHRLHRCVRGRLNSLRVSEQSQVQSMCQRQQTDPQME